MEYLLLGLQDLNFDTKDGHIDGITIWVAFADENVIGRRTEKKFINRVAAEKMHLSVQNLSSAVNKTVRIFCDMKGRLVMMQLPEK